jgi:hypothetical protein
MLEKLGVLEKLPFGIGDKFKGMKDAISDSADKSAEKIEELQKKAKENDKRIGEATKNIGASFGDAGKAIANDVSGIIDTLNIFSTEAKASAEEQTDFAVDEYEYQTEQHGENAESRTETNAKEEEEQTEKTEEEAEKRAKARENFEEQWSQKLTKETETRLEALEREKQEALDKAEELGASKADIVEYFAIKEQEIIDAKAEKEEQREQEKLEKIESLEEEYSDKVFQETSTRIEQLEREKQEAIEQAEEIGASKENIVKFYNLKITEEEEKQAEREREIEQQKLEDKISFEEKWQEKLFEQTATEEERLQKEYEQAIENAKEKGADTQAIHEYYANKFKELEEEKEKKAEERRKKEIKEEKRKEQEKQKIREKFEEKWSNKLFWETSSRLQILEREKQQALQKARELGVGKQQILDYYAQKEKELRLQQLKDQEIHYNNLSQFINDWSKNLQKRFQLSEKVIKEFSKSAADKIVTMFDQIAKGQKTLGEALKEFVITFVNMLEKQVIAQQIAELAKAWAQTWWDWSAVGRAAAAIAKSAAVFEGAKALIRGMAEGGLVEGPTVAMVGEGPDKEAVLPLNNNVFSRLGQGIAKNMQASGGRSVNVNFYDAKLMSEQDMDIFMNRAVRYIKDVGGLSNDQ